MKPNKKVTSEFQKTNAVDLQAALLCLGYCRENYEETADVNMPYDIKLFILKFFADKIAQEPQEAPQQSKVAEEFDNRSVTSTPPSRIATSMSDSSMSLFSPSSGYANVSMQFLNFYGSSYLEYNNIQDNSDTSSANAECADTDVPTLASI